MPILAQFPVTIDDTVRWGDMDAFQHVNNTVFFQYFESARIAYFAKIGFERLEQGESAGPILASTHCRFKRPLRYPDTLRIGARVTRLADDRFEMEYAIYSINQAAIVAEGAATVVAYDYAAASKSELPPRIMQNIRALENLG